MPSRAAYRHQLVHGQAGAQLHFADARATVDRPRESERLDKVRRDAEQSLSLPNRLVNEMELALLQIADAAVYQARRATRGSASEIVPLEQADAEAAHDGVARDAAAIDATA